LQHVDLAYFDIKHVDPVRHEQLTGVSNARILENLRAILSTAQHYEVIVRITTIPGVNDSEENVSATAELAAELGCEMIELVPYHRLGVSKYAQYGMEYPLGDLESPTRERMETLRGLVESFGLREMTGAL
jgi:pyruvate formate lyase activating enzyme